MGIIENAKEMADLIKKVGDIELYRKIVDLEGDIVTLSRENLASKEEIGSLKKSLSFSKSLMYKDKCYWAEGDNVPFCSLCWERDKIAIHLMKPPGNTSAMISYYCPNCKTIH